MHNGLKEGRDLRGERLEGQIDAQRGKTMKWSVKAMASESYQMMVTKLEIIVRWKWYGMQKCLHYMSYLEPFLRAQLDLTSADDEFALGGAQHSIFRPTLPEG